MEEIGIAVEKKVCRTRESLGFGQLIGIKWLQLACILVALVQPDLSFAAVGP
jgi:hypothetical protein